MVVVNKRKIDPRDSSLKEKMSPVGLHKKGKKFYPISLLKDIME